MRETWAIDESGRVRPGAAPGPSRAGGWVDHPAGVGAILRLDDHPAKASHLPAEILDLLERRFPGTRWFVEQKPAA